MSLRTLTIRLPATHPHPHPITNLLFTIAAARPQPQQQRRLQRHQKQTTRLFSASAVSDPSNLVQVYVSRSTDPYLNLSVEHFLLRRSHPDSVVLLLYANRPCVVIGRNQNPWVEVNLGLVNRRGILRRLRPGSGAVVESESESGSEIQDETRDRSRGDEDGNDDVLLVRRRSGGGTVFHDAGNVNYSVICPPAAFDRDKHAEMVVRALRRLIKLPHAAVRVNERHDIVLDISPSLSSSSTSALSSSSSSSSSLRTAAIDIDLDTDTNTGMTAEAGQATNLTDIKTFKISGSAYKLTRTRSLHHGTCLLSSPHLPILGRLLRSPAAPYIKARGVESVRSPVRNVGGKNNIISPIAFEDAVIDEFRAMYLSTSPSPSPSQTQAQAQAKTVVLSADLVEAIPEVRAGVAELRSLDWIYAQTPQFVFSSHPTADDPRPRPDPPADLPASFFPTAPSSGPPSLGSCSDSGLGLAGSPPADVTSPPGGGGLQMTVRHGQITEVLVPAASGTAGSTGGDDGNGNSAGLVTSLKGLHLHRVDDWRAHVGSGNESVGRWLNRLFGVGG
ncbi:hypothetical protein F5Y14DRAFT_296453 [Nemania sp. NC0429]|nr:hypothetical protein F5Y14DRAFT_296453 [Nemania sp. NC0429]